MANLSFIFQEIKDTDTGVSGELDTTLTQPDKAADAKAVGEAIAKAFAKAATKTELAAYAKKTDLEGLATEAYVDAEISDSLSKFETSIKQYIEDTFLNGAW